MHGFTGQRTLMRIHLGERDKYHGRPLYQAIVDLLRARHYAGATVYRATMGFGASARLHRSASRCGKAFRITSARRFGSAIASSARCSRPSAPAC